MTEEAKAASDACLIVCITSDDEGRGYWCEWCPEAKRQAEAKRAKRRDMP